MEDFGVYFGMPSSRQTPKNVENSSKEFWIRAPSDTIQPIQARIVGGLGDDMDFSRSGGACAVE